MRRIVKVLLFSIGIGSIYMLHLIKRGASITRISCRNFLLPCTHTTRTPFRLPTCLPATRRCQIRLFDDDDTERGLFLSANGFLRPAVLFGQVSCGRSEINPSWCWHLPLCHMQLLSLHHLLTVYNDSYIFSVSLGTKLYME